MDTPTEKKNIETLKCFLPDGGVSADGAVPRRLHVLLLLLDRAHRSGQIHVHLQTSLETNLNSDGGKTQG